MSKRTQATLFTGALAGADDDDTVAGHSRRRVHEDRHELLAIVSLHQDGDQITEFDCAF